MSYQEESRTVPATTPEMRTQQPKIQSWAFQGNGTGTAIGRVIANVNGEIIQKLVPRYGHFLIGRSRICDLRLVPLQVSRHHALIISSSNGIEIVDLWSKNGTYIDDQLIAHHPLKDNDAISIGGCTIRYITEDF